jgi:hypothetical protein
MTISNDRIKEIRGDSLRFPRSGENVGSPESFATARRLRA